MTARINVSGKLMMDPESTLIGGEAHAGTPMLVRMRVSPLAEGAVGPAVLFVTARGSAADTLSGFRRGDSGAGVGHGATRAASRRRRRARVLRVRGRIGRAGGAALMGSGCDCARRLRGAEGP